MPATQRNPLTRLLITLAILVISGSFVVGLFIMSGGAGGTPRGGAATPPPTATTPGDETTAADTTDDAPESASDADDPPEIRPDDRPADPPPAAQPETETETPAPEADRPETTPADPQPSAAAGGPEYRARVWDDAPTPTPLGGLDPEQHRSLVSFTLAGAGVSSVQLARYFETIEEAIAGRANPAAAEGHYQLQRETRQGELGLISLAALRLDVDGQEVNLFTADGRPVWREVAPGRFEAEILDASTNQPALRVARTYTLVDGSYGIEVRQRIVNLTDRPITCVWRQYGPVDLNEDPSGYRIPTRRIRFGSLLDAARDPSRQIVRADGELTGHGDVIDRIVERGGRPSLLWPNPQKFEGAGELVWVGQTSRYFAFLVHPLLEESAAAANVADPTANPIDKRLTLAEEVYALGLNLSAPDPLDRHVVLQLNSRAFTVEPGASAPLDFAAYAGPMSRKLMSRADRPTLRAIALSDVVIYQIGMCGFCTFQPLARGLFAMLQFFYDYLVFDWGLAIILLVVCVRTALHPIFKRSQVGMMRFSRQMQNLAPKQKKLQEKYKDDPQRLRQEMMKLMREENVNYAGLLGCLPMLLQSPIWIALYAMLYFAFELRHQPAFFGVFQAVSGNGWLFLADLSRPDQFIPLGGMYHVPMLSALMGKFSGINVLPLALGFVFYVHQKFLTPPTTATLTPEQQSQQKMIKIMMVVMFPVIMYNAPSGLTLYFITNSLLAIVEGRYIRSHVDKLDLEEPPKHKQLGKKKVRNEARGASPFKKDPGARNRFKDRG